jgi:MFS family permease
LFLVLSGTTIQAIDRSTLSVANSAIANDLHFSLGTMGIVLSAFGWAYFLGNLPSGWLCDRYGAKKIYGYGVSLWSIASAATGLATGLTTLLISRVFVGLGESVNFPAATKVIGENFAPSQRGRATGIYTSGLRIGFALTPSLMIGLMIAFGSTGHPNWRVAFLLTGLGSLLWVVLWFLTFPEKKATGGAGRSAQRTQVPLSVLLKFRNTWAMISIKFTTDYLYYVFILWLPGYLVYARHFNLTQVAFYSTMPFVAGMIAQVLLGFLCDKLINSGLNANVVKKTLLVVPQLISLTAVLFAAYSDTAVTAAWLLVIAIAGEAATAVVQWQIPQDLAARGCGGMLGGISNTSGALASIVSPIITGFIAQYLGFQPALILGAVIMAGSALCVMFFLTGFTPLNITDGDMAARGESLAPAS